MLKLITCTYVLLLVFSSGCASQPPEPGTREYREIPEAYLQECKLPAAPVNNAQLSDAFAKAYKCGEIGNNDKQRIRELSNSE